MASDGAKAGLTVRKGDRAIRNVEEWFEIAPPKGGERQWKKGRSAMELARAWCGQEGPPSIPAGLHAALSSVVDEWDAVVGHPEHVVRFDSYGGEPANLDLALRGTDSQGTFVVGIEAKADEPFGDRVDAVLRAAAQRISRDEASNAVGRIQKLASALLPAFMDGLPHLGELRYQLLTSSAATLALAKADGAKRAVFLVYELIDLDRTKEVNRRRNREDLDRFVRRLSGGEVQRLKRGELAGPWRVPGSAFVPGDVDLYVGKVRRQL